ncbi:hypothetical protein U1Q18_040097 [Sarracenia purpurea var. burkii]
MVVTHGCCGGRRNGHAGGVISTGSASDVCDGRELQTQNRTVSNGGAIGSMVVTHGCCGGRRNGHAGGVISIRVCQ